MSEIKYKDVLDKELKIQENNSSLDAVISAILFPVEKKSWKRNFPVRFELPNFDETQN